MDDDISWKSGDFFVGKINDYKIGVKTETHAITIAGSGTGKGACVIIPNIYLWPHNLLIVDPKGENARETVSTRDTRGQSVFVIDPFKRSQVDKKYYARINPLDVLNPNAITITQDIKALADGIVMRGHDTSSENWDDGAQTLIAAVIGAILLDGDKKNLIEVREIIADSEAILGFADKYKNDERLGGLILACTNRILAIEGGYYVSNAQKNTEWLDDNQIKETLDKSDFDISILKNGRASIYLVLPANYLVSLGRFLRLFVRMAIEEMARPTPDGDEKGNQCLFILDEFYSLGFIKEIAVSCGLMRGYGLQLWPILQNMDQLYELYGKEGAQGFFANSDLQQFFGNKDLETLKYMSELEGVKTVEDIEEPPMKDFFNEKFLTLKSSSKQQLDWSVVEENKNRIYQYSMAELGRPRIPPNEMAERVKKHSDVVADYMFCRLYGYGNLFIKPVPYFRHEEWD